MGLTECTDDGKSDGRSGGESDGGAVVVEVWGEAKVKSIRSPLASFSTRLRHVIRGWDHQH